VTEEGLEGFLDRLAAATPTPGGGAAAALVGAVSAALATMACRVTAQRGSPNEGLRQLEQEAEDLRARLTALVQRDSEAFRAVIAAGHAREPERPQARRAALVEATEAPVEVARAACRVLELCGRIAPHARSSTVSDLGAAVALAGASLEGAVLTARVNLHQLDDPELASRTRAILARLVEDAAVARQRLTQIVAARTGIPA
jgi:formiminotetrahydrofolate cyclodeaminase